MLNINIKATNIELTDAINGYVHEKMNAFNKILDPEKEAKIFIEIGKDNNHHKKGEDVFRAEITMNVEGESYRTEESARDLYAAIDKVKEEILREIKKKKGKSHTMLIRGARKLKKRIKGIKSWGSLK